MIRMPGHHLGRQGQGGLCLIWQYWGPGREEQQQEQILGAGLPI